MTASRFIRRAVSASHSKLGRVGGYFAKRTRLTVLFSTQDENESLCETPPGTLNIQPDAEESRLTRPQSPRRECTRGQYWHAVIGPKYGSSVEVAGGCRAPSRLARLSEILSQRSKSFVWQEHAVFMRVSRHQVLPRDSVSDIYPILLGRQICGRWRPGFQNSAL